MLSLSLVVLCSSCGPPAPAQTNDRGAWCRLVDNRYEAAELTSLGPQDTAIVVRPNADGAFGPADVEWMRRNPSFTFDGRRYHAAGYGRRYGEPHPPVLRAELVPIGQHDGATVFGWLTGDEQTRTIYVNALYMDREEPCRLFHYVEAHELRD